MRVIRRIAWCLVMAGWLAPAATAGAQSGDVCPPAGWPSARLLALKAGKFAVADPTARQSLALALTGCLGDPDPAVRDGVAFEALSTWMRAGDLDRDTRAALREQLLPMLTRSDPAGFRAPFAALVLAEVARTDRLQQWMSAAERGSLVNAAAGFLSGIRDYRAFSVTEGWRHGVAHGADFVLQLALNPAVAKPQLGVLLAAIATQVSPPGTHGYQAGESDRLARALAVIAQRDLHSDAEWQAWFAGIGSPAPFAAWADVYASESGIARRHNTRAFLLSLHASASVSENAGLSRLLPLTRDALAKVP
jgi:hypothetical protein